LYYNEFNCWRPSKLAGIVRLVKMLQAEGIRIDGVGIQAHWGLGYPKNEYIDAAIDQLSALGVTGSHTPPSSGPPPGSRAGH
ncbi:MAG: endo-1,4-beta-xylanase, partial [Bacteroidales bacterium]|nr:endo-1,4-beta-xylanase [Bacteroidales bacterium]